jgi:hypothetical protein
MRGVTSIVRAVLQQFDAATAIRRVFRGWGRPIALSATITKNARASV